MRTPLFDQARHILTERYGMPSGTLDELAILAFADSPRTAALTTLERCRYADRDRADCLLMLEICALELLNQT